MKKRWTEEELKQLNLIFPHFHNDKVVELMGNTRTYSAIIRKASKLGLKKSIIFEENLPYNLEGGLAIHWTPSMLAFLNNNYSNTKNADLSVSLGVSSRAVTRKAKELGLKKNYQWLRAISQTYVRRAACVSNALHAGQFKKGHPATSSCFKPGHKPDTIQPVIRLDTLQVYASTKEASEALGCCQPNVSNACRRKGNVFGVAVRFCSSMPCGSCRFLVGLPYEETHGDAICGCGLDSHITTTETTGCKKYQPIILEINE